MKAQTQHIQARRALWHAHWPTCPHCSAQDDYPDWCEQGQIIWDEYRHAISANRDLESVEATLPKEPQGCETKTLKP